MNKKIMLPMLAIAMFFSGQLFAQGFGLRAGVNFANLNGENSEGNKFDNKLAPGFHVGVNYEMPVATDFYLQPGLLYSVKGAKSNNNDIRTSLGYVEVPLNFVYKPELGMGKLILGFGPYLAYGLSGNVKNGSSTKIEWGKSISTTQMNDQSGRYYKPFDAGANFMFGYETASRISLQLNAGLGLVNIYPDVTGISGQTPKAKNTTFGLSLGYRLGQY